MAILVNGESRVICQGITGRNGTFHSIACKEYGTKMVGGVTPGKGGSKVDGIPVFNSVPQAVEATGANVSLIFIPAAAAKDPIVEAVAAGIKVIVCITEGIPPLDTVAALHAARGAGVKVIGPNTPGIISPPEACKVGIMPGYIHKPGAVGVISRSGTLTYRGGGSTYPQRSGSVDLSRLGWRPRSGAELRRRAEDVPRGPANGVGGPHWGDRWKRRGKGSRIHQSRVYETGGRVCCRASCASREADGACRRDHLGRIGHSPEQSRSPERSRRYGR